MTAHPAPRERLSPRRVYSLRELQRYLGLSWTSVLKYSKMPSMRPHKVRDEGRVWPRWRASAAAELLSIYRTQMKKRGRPRRRGRPPKTDFGEVQR